MSSRTPGTEPVTPPRVTFPTHFIAFARPKCSISLICSSMLVSIWAAELHRARAIYRLPLSSLSLIFSLAGCDFLTDHLRQKELQHRIKPPLLLGRLSPDGDG